MFLYPFIIEEWISEVSVCSFLLYERSLRQKIDNKWEKAYSGARIGRIHQPLLRKLLLITLATRIVTCVSLKVGEAWLASRM